MKHECIEEVKRLSGLDLLRSIGLELDEGHEVYVHDGGVVVPSRLNHRLLEPGGTGVVEHAGYNTRGPATGERERPTGWEGATRGSSTRASGSTCASTSLIGELGFADRQAVEGVARAYPQVIVRATPDLLWLFNVVTPVVGLEDSAVLVSAMPRNLANNLFTWAWWWPLLLWIGPRHTNYTMPGSVCAYEPDDGTWQSGDPLVALLDLQIVWVVRHIFLKYFGRWPGAQSLHTEWERIAEHRPGELCGGCQSGNRYETCCSATDHQMQPVDRLLGFLQRPGIRSMSLEKRLALMDRNPPPAVVNFVHGKRQEPPSFQELVATIEP